MSYTKEAVEEAITILNERWHFGDQVRINAKEIMNLAITKFASHNLFTFNLFCLVAIWLSNKFIEGEAPDYKCLCKMYQYEFVKEDLFNIEIQILKSLDYKINFIYKN